MNTTTTIHLTPEEMREMIREEIQEALAIANHQPNKMLRLKEAAVYLGISSTSLYRYATSGKIKAGRAGEKIWSFQKRDLDEWVSNSKVLTLAIPKNRR